jgi:hypothetical protein
MVTPSATGRRCKRECAPGKDRCEVHAEGPPSTDPNYMPRFYKASMRPALAAVVEAQLAAQPLAHIDTKEELAIARAAADDIVDMYAIAKEAGEQCQPGLLQSCAMASLSAMQDVMKMAETTAKIEHVRAALAGPMAVALEDVVQQLTKCVYQVFGDDHRVKQLEQLLRERVIVPNALGGGPGGTRLLPCDQDVLDMDATIPAAPEPASEEEVAA